MANAELIKALRSFDACESCHCEHPEMCENADCIVIQVAAIIEAQAKRIAELEAKLQKEGEWIDMGDFAMCSVCKTAQRKIYKQYYGGFMWVRPDFCGNCGSRMRK